MQTISGDGISDQFFHLLWKKDELNFGPSINIPDTVIFKFGQPLQWYFTSIDGKVKKKSKQNLVSVRIEEAFTRKSTGCDIIASYIECREEDHDQPARIEYFDRKSFHDFLYNRFKEHSGILQRFVEPKGSKNAMIRAIWSPKVCLLERRENVNHIQDGRFGIYERTVTYEGPEYFSQAAPLRGTILPATIQQTCENIVSHIAEVTFQKQRVVRMVLNFKVDARDSVWLLWSSSIRLLHGSAASQAVNIDSLVRLSDDVRLETRPRHTEQDVRQVTHSKECVSCALRKPSDQFHSVKYSTFILHFEQIMALMHADAHLKRSTDAWPPDKEIIAAAGGVGFGMLFKRLEDEQAKRLARFERSKRRKKSRRPPVAEGDDDEAIIEDDDEDDDLIPVNSTSVTDEDLSIPPVLRSLHPKLTSSVFRRYRRDPLFLFKHAPVCEDCFLVYAELSTTPSLRSGIQELQRSTSAPLIVAPASHLRRERSDWTVGHAKPRSAGSVRHRRMDKSSFRRDRPMDDSSSQRDGPMDESTAMKSLGTASVPHFPAPIHSLAESQRQLSSESRSVQDLIQEKEDAFFREISTDPSSRTGHPLTHLISSYTKIENANRINDLRVRPPKPSKSPYAVPQVIHGDDRVRATERRRNERRTKKSGPASTSKDGLSQLQAPAQSMSKSSSKHREFLLQTLDEVQHQLTTPNALKSYVEYHTEKARTEERMFQRTDVVQEERSDSEEEEDVSHDDDDDERSEDQSSAHSSEEEEESDLDQDDGDDDRPDTTEQADPAVLPDEAVNEQEEAGVTLLKTGYHLDDVFVAIKCFERKQANGTITIVYEVVYPLESAVWTLAVDPLKLGLEAGAWEQMPPDEQQTLCVHILDALRWDDDQHKGVHFAFDEE